MTRKLPVAALLALTAAVVLASCADVSRRDQLSSGQWRKMANTLEREGTTDALVTAALIREAQLRDSAAAMVSLDNALKLNPQQPDATWIALNVCSATAGCATAPYATKLAELDPGNAAAHYPDLSAARARGDVAAEDQALSRMANAGYFDICWSRLLTRVTDTLTQPRGTSRRPLRVLPQAAMETIGWLAADAIPPFTSTVHTCRDERLKREDVVAWCRKLAGVMDNSDTVIATMMARAIAKPVWAPESAEAAKFRERSRESNYVREALEPYNKEEVLNTAQSMQRWVDRFRTNRSEREVYRQWLKELGIPPDPPADWVSKAAAEKQGG